MSENKENIRRILERGLSLAEEKFDSEFVDIFIHALSLVLQDEYDK